MHTQKAFIVTGALVALSGGLVACGSHSAASRYPISAPECRSGWSCLNTNAGIIGYPILGPSSTTARLEEAATDSYETTPGAIEVDYLYYPTGQSSAIQVREVRGGPKPMCTSLAGAAKVTVRGTTGYWEKGPEVSRLCWTDETWSTGLGFPSATTEQAAVSAADHLVEYAPSV